ncbi:MAG: Rap1a/Tai family immunity protein [Janthinobacterium lividum]
MKKFWLLAAFLVFTCEAKATTGSTLYKACINTGTTSDAGWCLGYLQSFIDAEQFSAEVGKRPPRFCMPSNITMIHVRETAMKYMTTHTDKIPLDANAILGAALVQAYSCG